MDKFTHYITFIVFLSALIKLIQQFAAVILYVLLVRQFLITMNRILWVLNIFFNFFESSWFMNQIYRKGRVGALLYWHGTVVGVDMSCPSYLQGSWRHRCSSGGLLQPQPAVTPDLSSIMDRGAPVEVEEVPNTGRPTEDRAALTGGHQLPHSARAGRSVRLARRLGHSRTARAGFTSTPGNMSATVWAQSLSPCANTASLH